MTLSRRVALIIFLVVGVDQWTKHWAVSTLNDGSTVDIFWTLRFALGFNSGFAFSQGQGLGPIIGVIAIVAFVWLVRAALTAPTLTMSTAYALIASGAIGNVVDRMFREDKWMNGRVVDFIDFQWFPVFNIADSSITIGAVLLVLSLLRDPSSRAQDATS